MWCETCGSYTTGRALQLAEQCKGKATRTGRHNLRKLAKRLSPLNDMPIERPWPLAMCRT